MFNPNLDDNSFEKQKKEFLRLCGIKEKIIPESIEWSMKAFLFMYYFPTADVIFSGLKSHQFILL